MLFRSVVLEDGVEIHEPDSLEDYSGQFKLRIPRSLHRSLVEHSQREGISMNQYCVYLLSKNDTKYSKICNVNFSIKKGEIFALIGESGSGKTSVCKAILGLLEGQALQSGSIRLCGKELLPLAQDEHRRINGRDIGYIMQNPQAAFDPCMKIKNHYDRFGSEIECSFRSRKAEDRKSVV